MTFSKLTLVLPLVALTLCGCRHTSNRTAYCTQPAVVASVPAPPPCATPAPVAVAPAAVVPAPPPGFVR